LDHLPSAFSQVRKIVIVAFFGQSVSELSKRDLICQIVKAFRVAKGAIKIPHKESLPTNKGHAIFPNLP
jgi:hypothetical protein